MRDQPLPIKLVTRRRLLTGLALAVIIFAIVLAYLPGLSGPYLLDDRENIAGNAALAIEHFDSASVLRAIRSNDSGPFRRPIATLSFAVDYALAGGFENTAHFKTTNLAIHGINTILLFFLTTSVLRRSSAGQGLEQREQLQIATLTAALWALHPIQLTNVLYVVQRMNSLAALFVVAGLILFVHGRHRFEKSPRKGLWLMGTGCVLGTLLGTAAKENAALLPLLALAIEASFFQRSSLETGQRRLLGLFYFVILAIPTALAIMYFFVNPEALLDAYKIRSFSMGERLMTEARVLWHYAGLIALPATGNLGLFHDDIGVSTGLLSPPTTLLALLALGAVLVLAVVRRAHHPLICFAVLWFLAGHLLESSVFGLEIAYEHRNYLPSYGILFSVAMAYVWLSRRWRSQARVGVAVAMVLAVGFSTWTRADSWKDLASIAELEARHHPISPRANELAAWVNAFERGDLLSAVRYAAQGVRASPNEAGFHINLHLYMSLLSTELSHQVTAAGEHLKDGPLEIAGLDTGITATVRQGRIQLESAASTLDVINRLLEAKPVTVHTIGALDMLRRCILERPDICQRLAVQGLKWHIIAANNPATTTTYHALLLGNAAELYAARSEYPSAVEYVGRAGDVLPNVLFYKIRKAEYLVKLGHLDEARAVLAAILATDSDSDARFFNRAALLDVVQAYNEAAETGKTPHPLLSVRPEAARTP